MQNISFADILYGVPLLEISNRDNNLLPTLVTDDTRQVLEGAIFVAIKGTQVDGNSYISTAIAAGASCIVTDASITLLAAENPGITFIKTEDASLALGILAHNFYGRPSDKLQLIAVTGTNGKTTVTTLLYQLFRVLGYNTGLISTVDYRVNDKVYVSTHTTPNAVALNKLLANMVAEGCTHCFMEASSHAIVQNRMAGVKVAGAGFTNITHDHLDYHKTFSNYIAAKKKLFDGLPSTAFAITNLDDKNGRVMLQNTKAKAFSYALKHPATYKGKILANTLTGLEMLVDEKQVWFRLIGEFNASNILLVYGIAVQLGEDPEVILGALSAIDAVPGRFQQVHNNRGIVAIVDYAHTPDALSNVLGTIKALRTNNETLITVIGCGGNRDTEKRPLMAAEACKYSDKVILTSDNPRNENPEAIIDDMRQGVSPSNYRKLRIELERSKAIALAVSLANDGDIILVAGKGHETYQEINGVKHPFDDRIILADLLNNI